MKGKTKGTRAVRLVEPTAAREASRPVAPTEALRTFVEGNRLIIDYPEGIELRCGDARVVLTKDGKILIEGAYVSADSTGPLRLVGASVDMG